jgi:hypothetical protein
MTFWQAPAVLILVVTWLASPPTSLAELSRREALRRQAIAAPAESLTNDTLPYMAPVLVSAASASAQAAPAVAPPVPAQSQDQADAAAPDEETRGEEWWRTRAEAARAALERDQVLLDAMQTRVNSLQMDIVNRDDPGQRGLLQQQLTRALNEMERLKQQIETDRQAIVDLETDARQQGVPPGWIR